MKTKQTNNNLFVCKYAVIVEVLFKSCSTILKLTKIVVVCLNFTDYTSLYILYLFR